MRWIEKWRLIWVFPEMSVDWNLDLKNSTHNSYYYFVRYQYKCERHDDPMTSKQLLNYNVI